VTSHPSLPGSLADASLADSEMSWPVTSSEEKFASGFLRLTLDTIVSPDGGEHPRAVVRPRGAVAVLAVDDEGRILVVDQYRHPVGRRLLELPAGTLDVEGEEPVDAAARELAEEADVRADTWEVQLTMYSTPGYSSEAWTIYRATDLTPVPDDERTEREAEEADMHQWWMPLDDAVAAVLDGRIADAKTAASVLAEQVRRSRA
jgi:ADP-ribose pyrophosphatase